MFKGFRDFILRGNVIDLAVAVVIGAAFTAVVTAFGTNFIEPIVNSFFSVLGIGKDGIGGSIELPGEQQINIGGMVTAIINFIITAAIVYFVLRSLLADYGSWYLVSLGVLAIAVMLVERRGIWGAIQARTGIELFPIQRRIRRRDLNDPGK